MSEVIQPSWAPLPPEKPPSDPQPPGKEGGGENEGEPPMPITDAGQVCYERVLPSQDHFYKVPDAPKDTGEVSELEGGLVYVFFSSNTA